MLSKRSWLRAPSSSRSEYPLRLFIERADDFAQVIDIVVGGLRASVGFERRGVALAHHADQYAEFEDEMDFSCASISLRAERVDFTLHVEHRTLRNRASADRRRGTASTPPVWSSARTSGHGACLP